MCDKFWKSTKISREIKMKHLKQKNIFVLIKDKISKSKETIRESKQMNIISDTLRTQ